MSRIQAIVFDCFGVLTTEGWLTFKHQYFDEKPEKFARASELTSLMDNGLLNFSDWLIGIAGLAKIPPDVAMEQIQRNVPNQELLDVIEQQLKHRYKIGILSNAAPNLLNRIFTADQLAMFDAVAVSSEIGVSKPDPRAFEVVCRMLDVEPRTAVFIDDQDGYCQAAAAIGMKTIRFTNNQELMPGLSDVLDI